MFPQVKLHKFKTHNYAEGSVESVLLKGRYFSSEFLVHVGNIIRGIVLVYHDSVISGSPPRSTVSVKSVLVSSLLSESPFQMFYVPREPEQI